MMKTATTDAEERTHAGQPTAGRLDESPIVILPPADVMDTLDAIDVEVTTAILDPWYNRGVGGVVDGYEDWLVTLVRKTASIAEHVFLWGFPEIVCCVLSRLPPGVELVAWLTWYYKNCPSVIRGWRSAQLACLHLARPEARLYPEHFLNDKQLTLQGLGKLRYMPGPPSVIEAPLNVGFVGKNEQTGHPAQKPVKVFEPLVLMTTQEREIVLDPMCGAGTTGVVCRKLGRRAILADASEEYTAIAERRLGVQRISSQLG